MVKPRKSKPRKSKPRTSKPRESKPRKSKPRKSKPRRASPRKRDQDEIRRKAWFNEQMRKQDSEKPAMLVENESDATANDRRLYRIIVDPVAYNKMREEDAIKWENEKRKTERQLQNYSDPKVRECMANIIHNYGYHKLDKYEKLCEQDPTRSYSSRAHEMI